MTGLKMKYFVLKPRGADAYAYASRRAMYSYADAIEPDNLELANELRNWAACEAEASTKAQKEG